MKTLASKAIGACLLGVLVSWPLAVRAQLQFDHVPPVQPTRSEDCAEHSRRWQERLQRLQAERLACDRRDGGTVRPVDGPWLPNCGTRMTAYVTCAPLQDQLCAVGKQRDASTQACYAALSRHQAAERVRDQAAQRNASMAASAYAAVTSSIQRYGEMKSTYQELADKGIVGTVIDRYTTTPDKAVSQVGDYLRDAARTANTRNPDASPALVSVGKVTDGIYERAPFDPLARELGSQSSAAARARMGDALADLDRAMRESEARFAPPTRPAPTPTFGTPAFAPPAPWGAHGRPAQQVRLAAPHGRNADTVLGEDEESVDDDPEQRRRDRNIAAMQRVIEQSRQLQQQLQSMRRR